MHVPSPHQGVGSRSYRLDVPLRSCCHSRRHGPSSMELTATSTAALHPNTKPMPVSIDRMQAAVSSIRVYLRMQTCGHSWCKVVVGSEERTMKHCKSGSSHKAELHPLCCQPAANAKQNLLSSARNPPSCADLRAGAAGQLYARQRQQGSQHRVWEARQQLKQAASQQQAQGNLHQAQDHRRDSLTGPELELWHTTPGKRHISCDAH